MALWRNYSVRVCSATKRVRGAADAELPAAYSRRSYE